MTAPALSLAAAPNVRHRWPLLAGDEGRMLGNWLLVWVVLANAGFAVLWVVGGPPRMAEIIAIGLIGILLRHQPRWVQFAGFCLALCYSVLVVIAAIFNLKVTSLLYSLRFLLELDPVQSVEYLVALVAILGLTGAAFLALRWPTGFARTGSLLAAILALFALMAADKALSYGSRGHYMREAAADAPFGSAVQASGVIGPAVAAKRNVLVVVVESLGQPRGNAELQRLLFARYRQPEVLRRYTLSQGTTPYYNSTTAGEVRELCGRWGDYFELVDRRDPSCLPARMASHGYATTAVHSFTGEFFDRVKWYPGIGFDSTVFADSLKGSGKVEGCGGVFPGACDRDVPAILAGQLKRGKRPQFLYWLTVNSHLPVPEGANLEEARCTRLSPELARDFPMICRQFAIYDAIDEALVREITAADFPPTDILLVGDHGPPYFDRHNRNQFAPDRVPWLMLRYRGDTKTNEHG